MSRQALRTGLSVLLGALIAGSAIAQPRPGTVIPTQGETGYLNGGIGKEQADRMREMSAQYPVRMTFSQHDATEGTDDFVADVRLRVTDHTGRTVVDLASQGPIFLLRLPDGAYTVEAEHQGVVKTRRFDVVAGRHESLAFSWS